MSAASPWGATTRSHAPCTPDSDTNVASTCIQTPYAFHPMYATSSEHTRVPGAAHSYNVAFSDEIGHFEPVLAVRRSTAGIQPHRDRGGPTANRGGRLRADRAILAVLIPRLPKRLRSYQLIAPRSEGQLGNGRRRQGDEAAPAVPALVTARRPRVAPTSSLTWPSVVRIRAEFGQRVMSTQDARYFMAGLLHPSQMTSSCSQ
jgi:hypothetical protein